jgi:hypothetical protein
MSYTITISDENNINGPIIITDLEGNSVATSQTQAANITVDYNATIVDGVSIETAIVNSNGHLILTLTDGSTIDTGYVVGQGIPTGGTAGQVLIKVDGTNFNTEWRTASSTQVTDSQPLVANDGDQWFDPTTKVLSVWHDDEWDQVGADDLYF